MEMAKTSINKSGKVMAPARTNGVTGIISSERVMHIRR